MGPGAGCAALISHPRHPAQNDRDTPNIPMDTGTSSTRVYSSMAHHGDHGTLREFRYYLFHGIVPGRTCT